MLLKANAADIVQLSGGSSTSAAADPPVEDNHSNSASSMSGAADPPVEENLAKLQRTVPPHIDWQHISRYDVFDAVNEFNRLCKGYGHCSIRNAPRLFVEDEPFLSKVKKIIEFCFEMVGHDTHNLFYDDALAEHIVMHRYRYFWTMYKEFHRNASMGAAHATDQSDAIHIPKFSMAFEILKRIHYITEYSHDLTRFIEHEIDAAIPPEVTAGMHHQSLIRLWNEDEDVKPKPDLEELILYILSCCNEHRYRKKGDIVYEEKVITTEDGMRIGTYAWEPANLNTAKRGSDEESTIKTMVHRFCKKEVREDMWSKFINLRQQQQLYKHLEESEETEFPILVTKRNIFAFRNGIFDTEADTLGKFYPWESAAEWLSPDTAAARYIDQEIDLEWFRLCRREVYGWWYIETPLFQSILDYQNTGQVNPETDEVEVERNSNTCTNILTHLKEYEELMGRLIVSARRSSANDTQEQLQNIVEQTQRFQSLIADVCSTRIQNIRDNESDENSETRSATNALPTDAQKWVYILLGRLLHNVGKYDKWQVIPFFKGAAGTGKSTIGSIVKAFYNAGDVGILSNNIEKKFGLQNLLDKLMFVCLELKKNIQLDQAEFQSMVSGEDMSVPRKHTCTITRQWKVPGLLCGNEPPAWMDSQGSLARRLIVFNFIHKIKDNDSKPDLLNDILKKELAALIFKCNVAYRDTCNRHKNMDIWRILPQYFKDERKALARLSDPLCATIWDDNMFEVHSKVGGEFESFYITMDDFEQHYNMMYRKIRSGSFPDALTVDKYSGAFTDAGIMVRICTKRVDGMEKSDTYIIGIRHRGGGYAAQAPVVVM
mgnify:CR=1 FL=1